MCAISITVFSIDGTELLVNFQLEESELWGKLRVEVERVLDVDDDHYCRLLLGYDELADNVCVSGCSINQNVIVTAIVSEAEKVVVDLEEDFGFRYWLWHTGMTKGALEKFWTGLQTVQPYSIDPRKLPGVLAPKKVLEDGSIESFVPETLSWNKKDKACGEKVFFPTAPSNWWSGHIDMDDNSFLKTSDGRMVWHVGAEDPIGMDESDVHCYLEGGKFNDQACWTCGKMGHFSRTCWWRYGSCWTCGRNGHHSKDCTWSQR